MAITTEKRVSVFDIATPEERASYEELVNDAQQRVTESRDMPMATGAVLRIVDHVETIKPVASSAGDFAYVPPIC